MKIFLVVVTAYICGRAFNDQSYGTAVIAAFTCGLNVANAIIWRK